MKDVRADCYLAYMRGWGHATNRSLPDERAVEHPNERIKEAYCDGYDAGKQDRADADHRARRRWSYEPQILRTAALALAVFLFAAPASAHCPADCGCPCSSATPAPSATPKPSATPGEKCPPGTPLLNLGSSITRVIPAGARLIYCTRVQLASPPSRLKWSLYDLSDQDCGNLKVTVRQLSGLQQQKSSGPMANGSVQFTKRVGQGEDPARVANGDWLVTFEGFPAVCTNYLLSAGAQ